MSITSKSGGVIGDPPPFGIPFGIPFWQPAPSYQPPRTMPVNVPFSIFGVTIVTMDRDGNITIKLDQTEPVA